jgi:hypothetical protein
MFLENTMSILNSYLEKVASETGGEPTSTLKDKMGQAYNTAKDYLNTKKDAAGKKISEGYGHAKDLYGQHKGAIGKAGIGLATAGALYGAKKLYDRSKSNMDKQASLEVAYELGYNDALETFGGNTQSIYEEATLNKIAQLQDDNSYEGVTLSKIAMWRNAGY